MSRPPNARNDVDGPGNRPHCPNDWQAQVTREAALEIGRWLEARGNLHHPIASLRLGELEAMAAAAISRWVVLHTQRLQQPDQSPGDPIATF